MDCDWLPGLELSAKMKLALLCLCLASMASAAPSPFHYLPHYTGSRQQLPPSQLYPHNYGVPGGMTHGFLKYSIPQPPGRQSVELYYPFDFSQQKIFQVEYPPPPPPPPALPHIPQQTLNIPSFDANPLPSQDPLQPVQLDQPAQIQNQMPAKV
ncbi:hypothetical protein INR49_025767 [Caranx melampygus]|nr:hypothetical protein INR49_025767 [Caranx melampygus]